jgi:hypothetical protein
MTCLQNQEKHQFCAFESQILLHQPNAGMSKRTSYGKIYHSDVHFVRTFACVRVYPVDGFLPSADASEHLPGCGMSAQTRQRVRVVPCPRGHGTDELMRPRGRGSSQGRVGADSWPRIRADASLGGAEFLGFCV